MEKLVRDKIPEIIEKSGMKPIWRECYEEEFYDFLLKKLQEEVDELKAAKTHKDQLEEAADVYEVLFAIISYLDLSGKSWEEWMAVMLKKREERGQFDKRIILEEVKK